MKISGYLTISVLICLFTSCMDETSCPCLEEAEVIFDMKDIPYIFEGNETVGYRPYYSLVDRLNILTFQEQRLHTSSTYDYNYCKEHPDISMSLKPGSYHFLFVGNLFDHKMMNWKFTEAGKLEAIFRILDHREPDVYFVALSSANLYGFTELPLRLQMLVSRLEIKVVNPPEGVTGFDFSVHNIAREIIVEGKNEDSGKEIPVESKLNDTTSVYKTTEFQYAGPGEYWVGVNTFPTYKEFPALVDVQLKGSSKINQLVINDDRLVFRSGRIIRLSILFVTEDSVTVSVEVNGKWEIIDEGKIEI